MNPLAKAFLNLPHPRTMLFKASIVLATMCFTSLNSTVQAATDTTVKIGKTKLHIHIDGKMPDTLGTQVSEWINNSANAVAKFYGAFPVNDCSVKIHLRDGHGFGLGSADLDKHRAVIDVPLGLDTTAAELRNDWVLTHEMVHFAFPLVRRRDRWLVEGMATYVEPIARLQLGTLTAQEVWGDLVKSCPRGLALNDTETLSTSRRIPRMYWGGATFCLLADLELRKESNNRFGLQQALSAISAAGANVKSDLEPRDALALGDKALGVNTLVSLYDKMSSSAERPNLDSIFASLGVKRDSDGKVTFDDSAPFAQYRLSINSGLPMMPQSR